MPIFISFYVGEDKSRFRSIPSQKWNYDKLMECINSGKYRTEFIKETEECCKTFFERHPTLLDQHTPDDLAENLMQELVTIAQKYFHKDNKTRSASYEKAKHIRNELLAERGRLRIELHKIPPNPESEQQQQQRQQLLEVQADLKKLTQLISNISKTRQRQWDETCEQLTQELHEAWQRRDMKTSFNLMRRLAGSKFDVKKRDWRLAQQALPTRAEWETLLAKPGHEGGMSAKTSTLEDMRREHVEIAAEHPLPPRDMNHIQSAKQAIKDLSSYVIFATKRKAVPKNALPTEALVALLAPNYTRKFQTPALQSPDDLALDRTTEQVSTKNIQFVRGPAWPEDAPRTDPSTDKPDSHNSNYKAPKLLNPHTQNALLTLHTHIERTGQTPLVWHRSQGLAISKHINKKGADGSRLIHVLDPMGKAFFSKKHAKTQFTHNDTGFAAHRRREYATLCQNCTNFKLTRAKRNFINNNHDCTNAFCCTSHEECDRICEEHLFTSPENIAFGKQRHRYSSSIVQAREDKRDPHNPLFIRPQEGSLQGDTQAVKTFPIAFEEPVSHWILQHLDVYSIASPAPAQADTISPQVVQDYNFCIAICPQTNQVVDTAHTKYADDIVKTILGPLPDYHRHGHRAHQEALEGLVRRAESSSLLLTQTLARKGYAQNASKLIGVIGLNGPGAHRHLRELQRQRYFSYDISDNTKSLGSIINSKGTFQHELRARLDAIAKARFILGKRITQKRMPWKLKRTLLIGQVLNVALSGVEAYALHSSDYDTLQTAVTQIFRRAMGKRAVQLFFNHSTGQYEVEKQVSNETVLRYWNIPTILTELIIRRIRMYQSLAENPKDSVLPMAAAFGKIQGDSSHLQPPIMHGRITQDATPWAQQFQADMEFWCTNNEDANELFQPHQYRFFDIFTHPQTKTYFLSLDPTILRTWERAVMIPHSPPH